MAFPWSWLQCWAFLGGWASPGGSGWGLAACWDAEERRMALSAVRPCVFTKTLAGAVCVTRDEFSSSCWYFGSVTEEKKLKLLQTPSDSERWGKRVRGLF